MRTSQAAYAQCPHEPVPPSVAWLGATRPRIAIVVGLWLVLTVLAVDAAVAGQRSARLPVPGMNDVNGDGRDDLAVWGATSVASGPIPSVDPPWPIRIVAGKTDTRFVDVRDPGSWGYVLDGPFGWSGATAVGDINCDRRGDFLTDMIEPGPVYKSLGRFVVYGQTATGRVPGGGPQSYLRIHAGEAEPYMIVGVGDVNGDGCHDLAAYDRVAANQPTAGRVTAYLIYGARDRRDVDVLRLDNDGVQIRLPGKGARARRSGLTLAGVGDLDDDGFDDLAVGVEWYPAASCGRNSAGRSRCDGRVWVIYGAQTLPTRMDVRRLGSAGMTLVSKRGRPRPGGRFSLLLPASIAGDLSGFALPAAAAGDLDGNGYDDMLLQAAEGTATTRKLVIWGRRRARRPQTVTLTRRTTRIDWRVDPIGDFDGDGRADLLGFPDSRLDDTVKRRSFLIRGHRWHGMRRLDPRKQRAGHLLVRHTACEPVQAAGDVNGDGFSDVSCLPPLLGYPAAGWVIFGSRDRRPIRGDHIGQRGFRVGIR